MGRNCASEEGREAKAMTQHRSEREETKRGRWRKGKGEGRPERGKKEGRLTCTRRSPMSAA
jgi:hypothetical protein